MASSSSSAPPPLVDPSKYSHSPVHLAVLRRDHSDLRRLLSSLPRPSSPSQILSESDSIAAEAAAESASAVIDRRDVPGRETPLHLAVRFSDPVSVDLLMSAGADWSLQNEIGWSALQESICRREEGLAKIIIRHYQPLAWAKWCRRLPRLIATMRRMRDFYLEISFHFESSVIPFISRIAPSDTYRIWKRGANLRADMTLAGFDGLRIQRADQSVLFLGDGSPDGRAKKGSLFMISHKDKEVVDALDGAGAPATDAEVAAEVAAMSQTSIFRPGIDVTQAVLLPQLNWRRVEKTEMVGPWKAKVYDMHHVVVSVKSRRVPGVESSSNDVFSSSNENDTESSAADEFEDILTEDEKRQLEAALRMENEDEFVAHRRSCYEPREIVIEDASNGGESSSSSGIADSSSKQQDKKGWFSGWGKRGQQQKKMAPPRSSLCIDEKVSDLLGDPSSQYQSKPGRHSVEIAGRSDELRRTRDNNRDLKKAGSENGHRRREGIKESEYKKGLRPTLWLASNFPLQTDELLPLLDILANKVKAIRRLRELLTTKLPAGTFPVKVAIPVVPTIRVLVTFTKFEELQPLEEFSTPATSPGSSPPPLNQSSSSWFQWIKAPYRQNFSLVSGPSSRVDDMQDPFMIPSDYTWTTPEAKKKKMQQNKGKPKEHGSGQ